MQQELSLVELDPHSQTQNHSLEDNQQEEERRSPHKKKKLTKFISDIFYKHCPNHKKMLFNFFWQSYSKIHRLDTNNATKRKTLERRFNEILNAMQACGFVKSTKKMIDIIEQKNDKEAGDGLESRQSKKIERLEIKASLEEQIIAKKKKIQIKSERRAHLQQSIGYLIQHTYRNRSSNEQSKKIDLQSLIFLADQANLPQVTNYQSKRVQDHQVFLRGQLEPQGEVYQMLKVIYQHKQSIKLGM